MVRGRGAAPAIEPADRSKSRRPQSARGRTSSWLFLSDRVEGLSRGTFDWPLAIPCLDTRFNARTVFADSLHTALFAASCIPCGQADPPLRMREGSAADLEEGRGPFRAWGAGRASPGS